MEEMKNAFDISNPPGDHSFGKYAKIFAKLTFLKP